MGQENVGTTNLGQVMRTVCAECLKKGVTKTLGCYVENRPGQKVSCMDCLDGQCPMPNCDPSGGLCVACLKEADERKQMVGLA